MSKKNKTAAVKTQLSKKQIRELEDTMEIALKVCNQRPDDTIQLLHDLCVEFKVSKIEQVQSTQFDRVCRWILYVWTAMQFERRLHTVWREIEEMLEQGQRQLELAKAY